MQKKAHRLEKPSGLLHMQYLENEANFSVKTTGHRLTYLNKLHVKCGAFSTKFTFD